MKQLKYISVIIALFIIFFSTQSAQSLTVKKEIEVQTKDARILKANVSYISIPNYKKYSTVLLLHSLGYSSRDWGNLINELNQAGYAVIAMDLRGHGRSVYNKSFYKKSWVYFTNKAYAKYPSDVLLMLKEVHAQLKNLNMNNMAVVGADIGANTAVLAAKDMKIKPKTLVLICPFRTFKGLYIPIAMTSLNMPILSMVSTKDNYSLKEQRQLAKFSQGGFYAQNYPQGGTGMLMLKSNPTMSQDITKWIIKYLK